MRQAACGGVSGSFLAMKIRQTQRTNITAHIGCAPGVGKMRSFGFWRTSRRCRCRTDAPFDPRQQTLPPSASRDGAYGSTKTVPTGISGVVYDVILAQVDARPSLHAVECHPFAAMGILYLKAQPALAAWLFNGCSKRSVHRASRIDLLSSLFTIAKSCSVLPPNKPTRR